MINDGRSIMPREYDHDFLIMLNIFIFKYHNGEKGNLKKTNVSLILFSENLFLIFQTGMSLTENIEKKLNPSIPSIIKPITFGTSRAILLSKLKVCYFSGQNSFNMSRQNENTGRSSKPCESLSYRNLLLSNFSMDSQ